MSFRCRSIVPAAALLVAAALAAPAAAEVAPVFSQTMAPGGGILRTSSFWADPSKQNDSDSDSLAWAKFTLEHTTTITRVRWWGQAPPASGFELSFWEQDPNTVAVQPHIVGEGSGPISEQLFASVSAIPAGGGLYQFTVDLPEPVTVTGGERYFLAVKGLTPQPFITWSWAQGVGTGSTFWWSRGAHMFFNLGEARAMELSADICVGDLDASGSVDFTDLLSLLADWGPCPGCAADLDGSGAVDFGDVLEVLSRWGGCA
jgi:hypothetical protein